MNNFWTFSFIVEMDIWHCHYEKKKIVDPTNSELSIKNSLSLSL